MPLGRVDFAIADRAQTWLSAQALAPDVQVDD